jgi:serine/threonine-protein kinase
LLREASLARYQQPQSLLSLGEVRPLDWDPAATGPDAVGAPAAAAGPPNVPGYEILGELGQGGMGLVYKARHLTLNRLVALKMIRTWGYAGSERLARFRREAEAVAQLQHANVVQVYDVGEADGQPYISLEFIDGGSLAAKLTGTPLPPPEAAMLVASLAKAVAVAHRRGIIHRDLKPSNVLLTADGTPKITDFGLAKKLDDPGDTREGEVVGTPSFMAPEQAAGRVDAIGPATDVYGLGAILYECLTGRPPFRAATAHDTIQQVLAEEPMPPSRWQPKLSRDLETICLKCLNKDPARRYGSADDLAADLKRWMTGELITARPVGLPERALKWLRRRPTVKAFLWLSLLTGCMALLFWLFWHLWR